MSNQRSYSRHARQAALLMGERVRLERKERQWTEKELAERAGISRATLQKIERGDLGCAIGLVFEVASLVGIELFESDKLPLEARIAHIRDKSALLPQRIKDKGRKVDDDF